MLTQTRKQACLCGCGEMPSRPGSRFLPGHDAKLKSQLTGAIREGRKTVSVGGRRRDPRQIARELGWPLAA